MTGVVTSVPECSPGPEPVELLQRVLVEVLFHSPSLLMHYHVDQGQGGIEMLHSNCYILEPLSQSLLKYNTVSLCDDNPLNLRFLFSQTFPTTE